LLALADQKFETALLQKAVDKMIGARSLADSPVDVNYISVATEQLIDVIHSLFHFFLAIPLTSTPHFSVVAH